MITVCLFISCVSIYGFMLFIKKATIGSLNENYEKTEKITDKFQLSLTIILAVSIFPYLFIVYFGYGFKNTQHYHLNFSGIEFNDTLKYKNTLGKSQSLTQSTNYDLFFTSTDGRLKLSSNSRSNTVHDVILAVHDSDETIHSTLINKAYSQNINDSFQITVHTLRLILSFTISGKDSLTVSLNQYRLPYKLPISNTVTTLDKFIDPLSYHVTDEVRAILKNLLNDCKLVKSGTKKLPVFALFPGAYMQSKQEDINVSIDTQSLQIQNSFISPVFFIDNVQHNYIRIIDENGESDNLKFTQSVNNRYCYEFNTPIRVGLKDSNEEGDTCDAIITTNENTVFSNNTYKNFIVPRQLDKDNIYNVEHRFTYLIENGNRGLTNFLDLNGEHQKLTTNNEILLSDNTNQGVRWKLDLIDTSPKYFWAWLLIPLVLIFLLIYHSYNHFYYQYEKTAWKRKILFKNWQKEHQYKDFNPTVSVFLLTIIPLLALRIFLMWRANSFPPLSAKVIDFKALTTYFSFSGSRSLLIISLAIVGVLITWYALFIANWEKTIKISQIQKWISRIQWKTLFNISFSLIVIAGIWYFGKKYYNEDGRNLFTRFATVGNVFVLLFSYFICKDHGKYRLQTVALIFALIIILLIEHAFSFVIIAGFAFWTILFYKKNTAYKIAISVLIPVMLFSAPFITKFDWAFNSLSAVDNQTAARVSLMAQQRDSLLLSNPKVLKDEDLFDKIISTSQNQSFINWYSSKSPFFSTSFTPKPHYAFSNRFQEQATDLTALRYILSEHGYLTLLFLLLLLLAPLYSRLIIYKYSYTDETTSISPAFNFDILLLLIYSLLSFFVIASSTNLYLFIGLDIPIISFHSAQSIVLIIVLLFVLSASFNKKTQYFQVPGSNERTTYEGSYIYQRQLFVFGFFGILILTMIFFNSSFYKNKIAETRYNLDSFSEKLKESLQPINGRLQDIQIAWLNHHPNARQDELVLCIIDSINHEVRNHKSHLTSFLYSKIREALTKANHANNFIKAEIQATESNLAFFKFNINPYRKIPFPEIDDKSSNLLIYALRRNNQREILCRSVYKNNKLLFVYPKRDAFPLMYELKQYIADTLKLKDSVRLTINLDIHDSLDNVFRTDTTFIKENVQKYMRYHDFALLNSKEMQNVYNGTGIWYDIIENRLRKDNFRIDTFISDSQYHFLDSIRLNSSYSDFASRLKELLEDNIEKKCNRINITAVDNYGNIKVLYSYNSDYRFDPNKFTELNKQLDEFKYSSTNESALIQSFLLHPCLQKLDPGPGSSIKPILYDAIASQAHFPWASLSVVNSFNNFIYPTKGKLLQQKYAEENILSRGVNWNTGGPKGIFSELSPRDYPMINPQTYIANSSNLYQSIILFLGYHSKRQLENRNTFLSGECNVERNFPLLEIQGDSFCFRENQWPIHGFYSSVLYSGLKNKYDFKFSKRKDTSGGILFDDNWLIFGNRPCFDTTLWTDNNKFTWFKNYIQTATAGGEPIYVCNLQMSYLTSLLFSQNQRVRLKWVSDNTTINLDQQDSVNRGYLNFLNTCIYLPMTNNIFNDGGTLDETGSLLESDNVRYRGHISAKTGTINSKNSGKPSDKLLMGSIFHNNINPSFANNSNFLSFFIQHQEGGNKNTDVLRKKVLEQLLQNN